MQTLTRRLSKIQLQPRLYLLKLLQRQQTQLDEHQTNNCYDGDSVIHQGYLRNHRTNSTTTRHPRCSQTYVETYGETGRNLDTRLTEHRRAAKNGDNKNNIAEHHLQTDNRIDWDSAGCISFSTDYYQRLTLGSWYTNLEQTPLNRCQQLPAPYKRLINHKRNKPDEQTNQTHDDQSVFTANNNTT